MVFIKAEDAALWIVGAAVAIVLAAAAFGAWRTARRQKLAQEELAAREIAVIVEDVTVTGVGVICTALLILTVIGTFLAYSAATTIFQQIQAGVSLIGGCALFGLGAALGRKRTYRVHRSLNREP